MDNYINEDKYKADYTNFSLVSGGLIYKLTSVFRGKPDSPKGLARTAIALSLFCWLPMCILAILAGTLNDDQTTINFFEDFLFQVSFLFVVPFLILIEPTVNRSFVNYIQNSDFLIPNSQQENFNKLVSTLNKLSNSYIPEILVLIVNYTLIYLNWDSLPIFDSGDNYIAISGSTTLNAAGWYYILICTPILQLLIFRWLWRWIIWAYSIYRISKFKLQIDPLHADQMAGLAYANNCPVAFGFLFIALSSIVSATLGINIIYHDVVLKTYTFPILLYVILLPVILYSPLLFFIPFLIKAKFYGIHSFGNLIRRHNIDYRKKWIDTKTPPDDKLLGSVDNSSLADINGSYGSVQGLKLIPIDTKFIILSMGINALPFIPLIFTYYSIFDLFKMIASSMLGG